MDLMQYNISMLITTVIVISMAFVFYSLSVWGGRMRKTLGIWQLAFYVAATICYIVGVVLITELVRLTGGRNNAHVILETIAIIIICAHTLWAGWILWKPKKEMRELFMKYSPVLWGTWLFFLLADMFVGISGQI